MAVGKKGKGAGYYCEACDLTYKDLLQWVDHLNSKQHLVATRKTAEIERATLRAAEKTEGAKGEGRELGFEEMVGREGDTKRGEG